MHTNGNMHTNGATRKVYDRLANVYPVSTLLFHSRAHGSVIRDAGIRNGMTVLEVATGSGEMFERLVGANLNGTTVGGDIAPNMAAHTMRRVRQRFPQAAAHCQAVDARLLPFRDETFDAVICCYLLELLDSDGVHRALNEIRRVLKPSGILTLILIGQNTVFFNNIYKVLGGLVPAFWGRQIERRVPELLHHHCFRIERDHVVSQNFYPSRVLTARK